MLDIVIPVYNEGDNIEAMLNEVSQKIRTKKNVLIIYDSMKDTTLPIVEKIRANYDFEIKLVKNIFGRGALNAIKSGFIKSEEDAVLVTMADLSDGLEAVDKMYGKFLAENADVVCGSRYMRGGKQSGGPLLKSCLSRIAGCSLHWLIGIPTHDVTNSFKLYSKRILDAVTIESDGGFAVGMEIAIKAYAGGYHVTEVPATWRDREKGESNFKMWTWMPCYLRWYLYGIKKSWFARLPR